MNSAVTSQWAGASERHPAVCFGTALVLLACLGLGACRHSTDDRTTLTFWAMGREGEVVAQLLPEFERRHPDIHVDLQQLPWTAAHEKLLTAFAGDALPDICQLGNTWIPEFAALGALDALDPRVAASASIDKADYFSGVWDTNIIDGALLGVPWYVDTRLLFYRKDLLAKAGFAEPPVDWKGWHQAMLAIKRNAGDKAYAILLPLDEFEPLLYLAIQQDEPLLRDNGTRGNFENPGFRKAFDFYTAMFSEDLAPRMSDTQISNVWNEFANGFFAFYITGPWNIGEFKRRLPAELADQWMTAPLPGLDGHGGGVAGGTSLVLFRDSAHKDAAWALLEYLSEPDVQRQFYTLTGDLPPRRSVWDGSTLAGDPHARAFREQLEHAKPTPKVAEWERIANEMQRAAERVVRGGANADETLHDLDSEVDKILEKRRWMLEQEKTHE
jgi:multiple sugar transport system substrate-binding protein